MNERLYRVFLVVFAVLVVVSGVASPAWAVGDAQGADLRIEQPRHVTDPVQSQVENGTPVYVAKGKHLEIEPLNFHHQNVTNFQVRENEGLLTYDKQDSEYVLNTQGNPGTYHVSWTVSENNQTTVYNAKIKVQTADYTHVNSATYRQMKADAINGSDIRSELANAGDPDDSVEYKLERSVKILNFLHNPFSALTGQFMALQTMRFLTPAGWLDLGIILVLFYATTRGLYATLARLRKQLEKSERISRREDIQYLKQYKSLLAGKQMSDVDGIDDHQAAVLEERLGTNLFTALRNFWNVWGADNLKAMYVDAMGAVGYHAHVDRDENGSIQSVDVVERTDADPIADGGTHSEGELVHLSSAPEDVLDTITWEQVDDRVFQQNPGISAVDHLMVQNRDKDADLISELNIQVPEDFQSRKAFMEALGRFIQHIQETEFTDAEGRPREDRTVLNHLFAFTTIMEQEYNIPLDLWWRASVWNSEGLDRDDEARSVLDDIQDTGNIIDDVETNSNGGGGGVGH